MGEPLLSPSERWEKGVPHDPRSVQLGREIASLDRRYGDRLELKFGGDGDNGEDLLYLLDIYFESSDQGTT